MILKSAVEKKSKEKTILLCPNTAENVAGKLCDMPEKLKCQNRSSTVEFWSLLLIP